MSSEKKSKLEEENKKFIYSWLDKNAKKSVQPHFTKILTDPLFRDVKGKWILVTGETGDISGKRIHVFNMEGVESERRSADGFEFVKEGFIGFCNEMVQNRFVIHYTNEDYNFINDKRFHFPNLKNTQQSLSSLVKDGVFYECSFNYPLEFEEVGEYVIPKRFKENKNDTIFDLLQFLRYEGGVVLSKISLPLLDKCVKEFDEKYYFENRKGEECGMIEFLAEPEE